MSAVLTAATATTAVVAGARGTWSPCGLSMVSAINPFSERSRGHRYGLTCGWFVAGALVGGAGLGLLGGVGALAVGATGADTTTALLLAAVVCLAAVAVDTGALGRRPPFFHRQVDETWLWSYRRWLYAAGFGLQIGAGLATYVMTASTVGLVLLAALTGSPATAVGTGLLFGLVRGSAVLLTARARTPQSLLRLHAGLDRLAPWSIAVVVATQAVLAAVLAGTAAGPAAAAAAVVVAVAAVGIPVSSSRRARSVRPPGDRRLPA